MAKIYKTDCPLTKDHIINLVKNGFNEIVHFTKAGILYLDNTTFIITGPLGSDRLTVKCKLKDCNQAMIDLENLLKTI